jgi:hypothetical protein
MWFVWAYVLFQIDPSTAGSLSFLFFYLTLGGALVGTFTVASTGVRRLFRREEMISRQVLISFRQGILFSFLLIISLMLLSLHLFTWWNVLILIFALSAFELIFLTSRRPKI